MLKKSSETATRPAARHWCAAALVITVLVGVVGVGPAAARTNGKTKAVLFVHGYEPFEGATDCNDKFGQMMSQMRSEGFTGPMVKVGFYPGDYNCDVNMHSYGTYDINSSWKEIAKAFSKYVYATFTSKGIAVDVVGYSMGGLITRGAVWGTQKAESGFSARIDVEDVVTLGTPHNGAAWYSNLCLWGQCSTLKPGATDLNWLNQNGNPQGLYGTEFTTIASTVDDVTPAASGLYMSIPSSNKVTYCCTPHNGSTNYMHTSTVITRSGNALAYAGQ